MWDEGLATAGAHSRQQAQQERRPVGVFLWPCPMPTCMETRGPDPPARAPSLSFPSPTPAWAAMEGCGGQGPPPRSLSLTFHMGPRGALGKSFPFLTFIPSRAQRGKQKSKRSMSRALTFCRRQNITTITVVILRRIRAPISRMKKQRQ